MDKVTLEIDCDSSEITVQNTMVDLSKAGHMVVTKKSELIAKLIMHELSALMKMSKEDLMNKTLGKQ